MSQIPKFEQYNYDIRPLSVEEGGGFMLTWPDLAGCRADGASIPVAMQNGRKAFTAWMQRQIELGKAIPLPGSGGKVADKLAAPRRTRGR